MKKIFPAFSLILILLLAACGVASPGAGQAKTAIRAYFEESGKMAGGNTLSITELEILEILPSETGENQYKVIAGVEGYYQANAAIPGDRDQSVEEMMAFLLARENDRWEVAKFYGSVSAE